MLSAIHCFRLGICTNDWHPEIFDDVPQGTELAPQASRLVAVQSEVTGTR